MSNSNVSEPVLPLIEVIRRVAGDWNQHKKALEDFYEEWQRKSDAERDATDEEYDALERAYSRHPIYNLFVLIEDQCGPERNETEQVAIRICTTLGLRQFKDLPSLRPVAEALRKFDADGTTARILAAFERQHPEMASLYRVVSAARPAGATASKAGASKEPKGKDTNGRMIKLLESGDLRYYDWTAEQFAGHLGCKAASTVKETKAWKQIIKYRAIKAAEKVAPTGALNGGMRNRSR